MGANTFEATAKGETAIKAFNRVVEQAQYDYGHAGYTGTIAEKDSFRMITVPPGITPDEFVRRVTRYDQSQLCSGCAGTGRVASAVIGTAWTNCPTCRGTGQVRAATDDPIMKAVVRAQEMTDDKWGPAGCVQVGPDEWCFFGWASS